MKVGILGSGDVAQSLGRGFARRGHDVMLGSRTPQSEKLQAWKKNVGAKGSTGSFADAARHGELLVVATRGSATEQVLDAVGPNALEGKLVIDATNSLDFSKGRAPSLLFGVDDSLGERVQRKLPKSKVVKAFNTVSHSQMVDPKFREGTPRMMVCGNDAESKKRVDTVPREFGWPGALDVGGIEAARWLEALVPLWVIVGASLQTWSHAFSVVQ